MDAAGGGSLIGGRGGSALAGGVSGSLFPVRPDPVGELPGVAAAQSSGVLGGDGGRKASRAISEVDDTGSFQKGQG